MEKEIKFRAWEEKNNVMHFDFQFFTSGDEDNDWICFRSDKEDGRQELQKGSKHKKEQRIIFDNPYFRQKLKIMQFTGLKDKNGKEIYEGDIVNFKDYKAYRKNKRRRIVWDKEYAGFMSVGIKTGDKQFILSGEMEVIGNIYENPKLMEEKIKWNTHHN